MDSAVDKEDSAWDADCLSIILKLLNKVNLKP